MPDKPEAPLAASARSGLIWGAGFTFGRDLLQFVTMVALVRLLPPETYGQATLAQTWFVFLAVFSFKTLAPYALQWRDPAAFDWGLHFAAGALLNGLAILLTNAVAAALWFLGGQYQVLAPLLAILSITYIVEIPGTFYLTWLQAHHQWKRMRTLLLAGSLLTSLASLLLAFGGAGVYALVAPSALLGLPLAVDFLWVARRGPAWRWSLRDYRDGVAFGLNRTLSAVVLSIRGVAEQTAIAHYFAFAALGVFSRANGLATLTSGRVGPVVSQTLYPVLTRAEAGSPRFRRFAGLLLQGVSWVTVPASAGLAIEARPIVSILYGARWAGVIHLLPLSAALVAGTGIAATAYQVLLANEQRRACLSVDVVSALSILAVVAVAVPFGVEAYLVGASFQALAVLALTLVLAVRGGGVDVQGLAVCFAPPLLCTALASGAALLTTRLTGGAGGWLVDAGLSGAAFAGVYLAVVRLVFWRALDPLLETMPGGGVVRRVLRLPRSGRAES